MNDPESIQNIDVPEHFSIGGVVRGRGIHANNAVQEDSPRDSLQIG